MRNFFYMLMLFSLIFYGCDQQVQTEDVPENIRKQLNSLYPEAENTEWVKEVKTFEASFVNKGRRVRISFDFKGNLVEKVIEIDRKEVPESILNRLGEEYNTSEIVGFYKDVWTGKKLYLVEIIRKNQPYKVYFTSDGRLIKQVLKISTKQQ